MAKKDKRVDAYLATIPDFAKPILSRIRDLVHEACPDCEETLKWGAPTIMCNNKILCIIASFKTNCMVTFWNGAQLKNESGVRVDKAWGSDGRFTKLSELPPKKEFIGYVKKMAAFNEPGAAAPKRVPKPKAALPMIPEFAAAMRKNAKAKKAFDASPPSHKREYLEWITDAKRDETRTRRILQAVEWLAEGKSRNWKYS